MNSPYFGRESHEWPAVTRKLLDRHPLDIDEIVEVTLYSWQAVLATKIGGKAQIGVHIFPRPQIMGSFLHELIPLEFSIRYPKFWRREQLATEKDLVYMPDNSLSVEIKTSSHRSQIFGNRSYAQKSNMRKKKRSGYFIAVNFEKFSSMSSSPQVLRICFGWIDEDDWIGQRAETGQQARLPPEIYGRKLLVIHSI